MVGSWADNRKAGSWAQRQRARRLQWLIEALPAWGYAPGAAIRVLDLGGTPSYWRWAQPAMAAQGWALEVTLVNLTPTDPATLLEGMKAREGDVCDLADCADASWDVAFSNSVIEHVGDWPQQQAMAREAQRVARHHYIQTPYRHFPLEPHFLFPGWQYLPVNWRTALLMRRGWGWVPRTPDRTEARRRVESIRLLNQCEMRALFPASVLRQERVLAWTKSLVALSALG